MSATREDVVRPPAASTTEVLQAPSATWTRFVLFGATLLFGAIPFYHWLLEIAFRWTPDVGECPRRTASTTDPGAYASALAGCPTDTFRSAMLLDLAPLVALLALAGIRYLRHPARIRRRLHLVPLAQSRVLPADHRPAVEAELARLAGESAVPELPVFLTHDDDRGNASTFGLPSRHEMRLDAGLLMRAKSDDEADRQHFRGTVRHELAHLRNRDIGITQLTDALWWAFVVLTAGPVLAVAVFDLTRDTAWADFVAGEVRGLAAVVVLVLLAHRAVRRAREHYADLRAALVDGGVWFANSMARAEEEEQEETRRLHGWARLRHWYDRAVDRHPSPTRRAEVFGDPTVLLRFHLGEAAVAGTAAGLGYQGVHLAISRLTGTWPWAPVLVGMILALPVAAVLAAGALREACAGPARRRFVLARAAAAALVTVVGLLLGEGLSWSALVVRWWRATLTNPGTGLVVAGVLAAGVVLVVGWLVVSADLAVSNGALRRPRLLLAAATGAAAVPLGGLFAFWGQAHFSGLSETWSRQLTLTYLMMTTANKGFLTAALVALAVLPLGAACLAARRPGADDGPSGPSDRRSP
ncbi:M48 family metalloprotease [Kitasatospora aburaviensis]